MLIGTQPKHGCRRDPSPRPLLYAHRGASAELPENTLPAFRRALELGADALETDAHLTADGHVVLSHDPSGARACGVRFPIRRARLDEIQAWDAGWGHRAPSGERAYARRGFRIPTLEEVLLELPGVALNVDAKDGSPAMVRALLAIVRRHRAADRVRVASFSAATLAAVRDAGYEGETGLARAEVARVALLPRAVASRLGVRGDAAQVPLRAGGVRFDTRAMVDKLHALGLRVDFWTVDDPAEAARLLDLGADGVMTDDPARLAPLFRARYGPTSR